MDTFFPTIRKITYVWCLQMRYLIIWRNSSFTIWMESDTCLIRSKNFATWWSCFQYFTSMTCSKRRGRPFIGLLIELYTTHTQRGITQQHTVRAKGTITSCCWMCYHMVLDASAASEDLAAKKG